MTDTKIVGSTTTVRLELPGYESTYGAIQRNEEFEVGACIGGFLVLVPFLWIMGYRTSHTFEMRPLNPGAQSTWGRPYQPTTAAPTPPPSSP